jgi:hypothetical protein
MLNVERCACGLWVLCSFRPYFLVADARIAQSGGLSDANTANKGDS